MNYNKIAIPKNGTSLILYVRKKMEKCRLIHLVLLEKKRNPSIASILYQMVNRTQMQILCHGTSCGVIFSNCLVT